MKILPSSGASIQRTDDDDNAEVYINNDSRLQAAAEVEESEVKMISPISGASIQRTDHDDGAEIDISERPVVQDSRDVVEMYIVHVTRLSVKVASGKICTSLCSD